jgi:alpha-galactosidase
MSKLLRVSLLLASVGGALPFAAVARAAQTTITISMASPPAAPRIQPPLVIGATPSAAFLYTIPATGHSPLTYSAAGMPAGLTLGSSSGTISGTAPAAGSYPITITVTNGTGRATATLTLMSGTMLRPTPPLGWNSYDSYGASITQDEVVQQAQALKTTLQPFGWNTVVIDYRWYDPEDTLDSNGRYLPSISKYPSATGTNGLKTVADQVHALGLGFGIHIMRGIPRRAVTANSAIASSAYHATDAANTNDTCPWDQHMWGVNGSTAAGQAWYDALFAQYAQWGIDFVKIDDMLNNTTKTYHQVEADTIRKSVDKSGRAIVVSFSPGADDPTWLPSSVADLNAGADMWRVVDDFWDYKAITNLAGVFTSVGTWQGSSGLVQGHWPDTDMLPLGYLGPRCEWHASDETTFTHNDQVTIVSLWTILPSPLIFGGNVQSLTTDATTGPWTVALLTNEEVLAVNQDALGTHAKRIVEQGTTEVWARDLSGNRKAVALFNRGTQDAMISVSFAQLGVSGTPAVRDLWNRADLNGMTTGISVNVPHGAAFLYTLSPPSATGTGGSGSTGGTGGTGDGGATGVGGTGGGGGAEQTGGKAGSGATADGGDGTPRGPGTGGTTGGAGSTQTEGSSSAAGAPSIGSDSSSGCSCDVGARHGRGTFAAVFLVGVAQHIWWRSRQRTVRTRRGHSTLPNSSSRGGRSADLL